MLGLKMRCAGGPPPRRARRFSTADSGQSRAGAASPGGYKHPAGQRRALPEGRARAAKPQLGLLKRVRVVGNRTRHPGRYLGPIKAGGGWPLAWVQHGRSPEKVGAQALISRYRIFWICLVN